MEEVVHIAEQIKQAHACGCEIAVVIGGGNILRGAQFHSQSHSIQEATAHYMGMLATVINGLALQDAARVVGLPDSSDDRHSHGWSRRGLYSSASSTAPREATDYHLGGRDGGPFVTTDTAAAAVPRARGQRADEGDSSRRGLPRTIQRRTRTRCSIAN
ncbi:MAG: hypothetical protein R3B96_17010 [Pirellulaceae bacterium]